jgi:lysozyme
MTRPVPAQAIAFIKREEQFEPNTYLDQGGVPTNGWGHTQGVKMGDTVTLAQGTVNLTADLLEAGERLGNAIGDAALNGLTDNQYSALLSFVFNDGAEPTWQIFQDIKAGNLADVPNQLARFVHVRIKGVETVDRGLVNRRAREIALWKGVSAVCNAAPASQSA